MADTSIPEIQSGIAVIHGITNNGTDITISGYATFLFESAKAQHQFDIADIKDAGGNDASAVASNEFCEMDVAFTPSGATRAAAAGVVVFPTPLSCITLANFKLSSLFNGRWQYRGGTSIDLQNTGQVKISGLKIRRYVNTTQNTSLTTTVTG